MMNEKEVKNLLNRLDDMQKQIDKINHELLIESNSKYLTADEEREIKKIRAEGDYRTLYDWDKEEDID